MNRIDRERHLFMLVAWNFLSDWLDKTSCLSKDERKRVKTATTHLLHTSDSIIARLEYCDVIVKRYARITKRYYDIKCIRDGKELSIDEIGEIFETPEAEGGGDY